VFPDLTLQLGLPADHARVAAAGQFGLPEQQAELAQLGQDGRGLRVGGRAHRPDPERLRPGQFQPGEDHRRRSALQRHAQAGCGQIDAEGGGAGPQVDAAEPVAARRH
jgi:hypothetical protein